MTFLDMVVLKRTGVALKRTILFARHSHWSSLSLLVSNLFSNSLPPSAPPKLIVMSLCYQIEGKNIILFTSKKPQWYKGVMFKYCPHDFPLPYLLDVVWGFFSVIPCVMSWSLLASGSSSLGSSPGRGHCVVFSGKTLYSHSACLHPSL